MNKQKKVMAKIAMISAKHMLMRSANSTSCVVIYQPKMPARIKEFKRTRYDFRISKKMDI